MDFRESATGYPCCSCRRNPHSPAMGSGKFIAPRSWRGACGITWSGRCEYCIYIPLIRFQLRQGTRCTKSTRGQQSLSALCPNIMCVTDCRRTRLRAVRCNLRPAEKIPRMPQRTEMHKGAVMLAMLVAPSLFKWCSCVEL